MPDDTVVRVTQADRELFIMLFEIGKHNYADVRSGQHDYRPQMQAIARHAATSRKEGEALGLEKASGCGRQQLLQAFYAGWRALDAERPNASHCSVTDYERDVAANEYVASIVPDNRISVLVEALHDRLFGVAAHDDPALALTEIKDGGGIHEVAHELLRVLPPRTAIREASHAE